MANPSGNVTQYSTSQLLFTDTGTGYGTIISRTLTVYDSNGNFFAQYAMGNSLTQIVPVTADGWFQFICVVVDNTGALPQIEVTYVATGFYTATYLSLFTTSKCGCNIKNFNMDEAEHSYNAALRFNIDGNGVASNACIVAANELLSLSIPQ